MADGLLERQHVGRGLPRLAGEGEVLGHERPAPGEHGSAEERVLELAHVSRPRVPHEELADLLAHADDRRAEVAVHLVDEELDQVGDVAAPLA